MLVLPPGWIPAIVAIRAACSLSSSAESGTATEAVLRTELADQLAHRRAGVFDLLAGHRARAVENDDDVGRPANAPPPLLRPGRHDEFDARQAILPEHDRGAVELAGERHGASRGRRKVRSPVRLLRYAGAPPHAARGRAGKCGGQQQGAGSCDVMPLLHVRLLSLSTFPRDGLDSTRSDARASRELRKTNVKESVCA
jgi:hypothetical protein